jgi:hypothetical protein
MRLELDRNVISRHPTAQDIATALSSLDDGSASFAVLGAGPLTYVQVTGTGRDGYYLEYQDGSLLKHHYCDQALLLGEVIKVFQAYAEGNEIEWRRRFFWTRKRRRERRIGLEVATTSSSRFTKLSLWAITAFAFIAMIAVQMSNARLQLWISVFFLCIALGMAVITTEILRSGCYETSFTAIERSRSPVQFWLAVALGYLVSLVVIVVVLLYLAGGGA